MGNAEYCSFRTPPTIEKQHKDYNFVGIFKRFYDKDITSYIAENSGQVKVKTVVQNFINTLYVRVDNGDSLTMCGSPGTGKTHLGISIIKQAMACKMSCQYITIQELVKKVRSTYKFHSETMEQLVKDSSEVKILVIDEVGVEVAKDDTTILFDIIDTRYRHQLPTIIISNLNHKKLTDYIGVRLMDRLLEGNSVVIAFDWGSYRQTRRTTT